MNRYRDESSTVGILSLLLALMLLLCSAETRAETPFDEDMAMTGAVELSDESLSHMRGRYAGPATVVYFGVRMETSWETAEGRTYTADLDMGVDLSGGGAARPVVTMTSNVNVSREHSVETHSAIQQSHSESVTSIRHVDFGGLEEAHGIVQGIQIAGDANVAQQDLSMTFGPGLTPAHETSPATRDASLITTEGAAVTAGVIEGGIGVNIDIPGVGRVTQQIGDNAVMQSAQLVSDMNVVHNVLDLVASIDTLQRPVSLDIRDNIDMLRGINHAGLF